MKKKHGWNSLENYLHIHEKILRIYSKYFISPKTYSVTRPTDFYMHMECRRIELRTYRGSIVHVYIEKHIEIKTIGPSREIAKTQGYKYHASLPTGEGLIRYCGPDDHRPYHHKHLDFLKSPKLIKVEDDDYPHVGEFFAEVLRDF